MNPDLRMRTLTPEHWQRIERIFHAAIEVTQHKRAEFLARACDGDPTLLAELQNLVTAFEGETSAPTHHVEIEHTGRTGETIGGYQLDAEIGQGGMGTVYLAHRADGEFEQQVALKVVSAHLRNSFFTERFRAERQILASLNHPNITRMLDGGVSGRGDPYLAMEYVDGEPIHSFCDERKLSVAVRIGIFLEVCAAVEYAHRKLIVHRDLKPGNILVTAEGVPKLLDFGTAKLLMTAEADSTTTRFGAMTPRYASPEQLRGEPASTAMDVYSLGILLHELALGAWPFGDPYSPIAGLERAMREVEPARPETLLTEESAKQRGTTRANLARIMEGDLYGVIAKSIESDARRRYASVDQFSDDLRRYLAGQPVLAREQTLVYRGVRFAQRNRWRLATSAALSCVLALSAFTAVQQYGREQRRLVQVRDLSQSYLTDILAEVGKLPGSMKARMLIVDRARRNLDQLLPEAPNDAGLRSALANAYLQLGDIQGKPFSVSVGDAAGARESYRKAERMAAQAGPNDWDSLSVLVQARNVIALIDARSGNFVEAMAILQSALEPGRRLWQEAPADLTVDGKPAAALYITTNLRLGHTMLNAAAITKSMSGNLDALAQFRRTIEIAQKIQSAHPGMTDMAGVASQYAGFALEGLGDRTGEHRYYDESVAAHRLSADAACKDWKRSPSQQTQRTCADALGEMSWAMHNAGHGKAAVEAGKLALERMEPVSRAEPGSAEAQQDLAVAYFHLGAAENSAGNFIDAIGHLRTAVSRLRPVAELPAEDPLETAKTYVDFQLELARAQISAGRNGEAAVTLEQTLRAVQARPKMREWLLDQVRKQLAELRGQR